MWSPFMPIMKSSYYTGMDSTVQSRWYDAHRLELGGEVKPTKNLFGSKNATLNWSSFTLQKSNYASDIQVTGNKDTRSGFGDGILEAARNNKILWRLRPILQAHLKLNGFIKEFPERFIQCGIAEANMMGIAAGLTIGGKIPYTTTFANWYRPCLWPDQAEHRLQR